MGGIGHTLLQKHTITVDITVISHSLILYALDSYICMVCIYIIIYIYTYIYIHNYNNTLILYMHYIYISVYNVFSFLSILSEECDKFKCRGRRRKQWKKACFMFIK